jgi:hypothetical protein
MSARDSKIIDDVFSEMSNRSSTCLENVFWSEWTKSITVKYAGSISCFCEQGFCGSHEAGCVCGSWVFLQDASSGKLNGTRWAAPAPLLLTSHPSSMCSSYHTQQLPLLPSASLPRLLLLFSVYHRRVLERLCGLVVRIPGYRSRNPGFDSQHYQIF